MPIICIGPVCIPITAIWPLLLFLFKPFLAWLDRVWPAWRSIVELKTGLRLAKKDDGIILPPLDTDAEGEPLKLGVVIEAKSAAHLERLLGTVAEPVVINYTAGWCGPCKKLYPVFADLAETRRGGRFVKADADKMTEHCVAMDVLALPTFHVYKGGKKVGSAVGPSEIALRALVATHCPAEPVAGSER